MKKLSFPTVKLGNFIREVKEKVKNSGVSQDNFTVYGVTNTDGITVTNNKASDDLGNYTVLRENQFAYNPYRVNVGSIGLSLPGTFGAVSPAYVVFETNGQISNEFLLYYLKSSLGINLIKWYGDRGGVRSALRFSDLKKIDFPDITLEQQNKLLTKIKKLDELLCELDKNLSDDKIEILRQSILQQAVEGKLCEQDPKDEPASVLLEKIKAEKERLIAEKKIKKQKPLPPISEEEKPFLLPKGWEWCRLGEIFNTVSGTTPSRSNPEYYNSPQYYWVKTTDLNNSVVRTCEELVSKIAIEKCKLHILPVDTVCIAMYGGAGTIGKTGILGIESSINQSVAAVLPIKLYNMRFLHIYLKSSRRKWMGFAAGSRKDPNINREIVKKFCIPIPPLAEQNRIVQKVDAVMEQCDKLKEELLKASQHASQLMEAILKESFCAQEVEKHTQIIEFTPEQMTPETELLAAARGKMREDTWEHLRKRALEIANEES